jgi:hypothetical protein
VFEHGFRAWPHVYLDRGRAKKFYTGLERTLDHDIAQLQGYQARENATKYTGLLRTILGLFGKGIIDSLEHTMKKYIRQTNGVNANHLRSEEDISRCSQMLCHNNNAERPFAVLRQYQTYVSGYFTEEFILALYEYRQWNARSS